MNRKNKKNRSMLYHYIMCLAALLLVVIGCDGMRNEEPLQICFIRNGDVWVMDEDGSNLKQLTFTGTNEWPSWSADGKYIVYGSVTGGHNEIFLMEGDGSNNRQLTVCALSDENYYCPTWLPDGSGIVYNRFVSTSAFSYIGIMDTKGDIKNEYLLSGINSRINALTISNDGKMVAYNWSGTNFIGLFNIMTQSNNSALITPTNYSLTWSPEGDSFAYIQGPYIYKYDISSALNTFSYSSIYVENSFMGISWRPSGDAIVLVSDALPYIGICIFNFNTNQFKSITNDSTDKHPCFIGKPR